MYNAYMHIMQKLTFKDAIFFNLANTVLKMKMLLFICCDNQGAAPL